MLCICTGGDVFNLLILALPAFAHDTVLQDVQPDVAPQACNAETRQRTFLTLAVQAILQSGNIRELEDRRQLLAQYAAALQAEAAAHEHAISFLRALLGQQVRVQRLPPFPLAVQVEPSQDENALPPDCAAQEEGKQAGEGKLQVCQQQMARVGAQIDATARSPPPPEMGAALDPSRFCLHGAPLRARCTVGLQLCPPCTASCC